MLFSERIITVQTFRRKQERWRQQNKVIQGTIYHRWEYVLKEKFAFISIILVKEESLEATKIYVILWYAFLKEHFVKHVHESIDVRLVVCKSFSVSLQNDKGFFCGYTD